jgi:hypothetical protein
MSAAEKSRPRRILVAVVIALALCLAAWLLVRSRDNSRPASYRRFVGGLPGGSRYTFLYPAYMTDIWQNTPSPRWRRIVYNVALSSRGEGTFSSLPIVAALLRLVNLPAPGENVSLDAEPVRRSPIQAGRWSSGSAGGGCIERLVDARTRYEITLHYSCPKGAAAIFRRNWPRISQSLAVLPPGAPVPKP